MSHVINSTVRVLDLAALRAAVEAMGCQLTAKRTYNWYGKLVGDHPLPPGRTVEQLGTCDYCIQIPGVTYEVGVLRQKDGSFTFEYDFFGRGKSQGNAYRRDEGGYHDGEELQKKFGNGLSKLQQQYNKQVVVKQAKAKGYFVREKVQANGAIKLQLVHA